ncbi:Uncharacterised protein [Sphingobacterium multivorum]|uniref:hypothetical protein n=1 Tax=Sphingobacterium multivorum TaxID=28454 RepID=UPI000E02E094|nr:hypothetical protein [Sphingobacterium multivorum]QQT43319.1 hypothetical protein I6J00_16365 [Sphingobacterium multivorum]QQT44928.1 hypothetical protein I6J00_25065 [Sphingobacterium multivorum]SUI98718.1 Uncharacterised protein [Sphingobacterium multivorum]SUJ18473.1 Uncharacterised protein [Sphingobacterium multivorum]
MNNEIQQRAKELLEQGAERRKKRFEKINRQEEKILRDQFAMSAINALIIAHKGTYAEIYEESYSIADKMLKARKEVYGE